MVLVSPTIARFKRLSRPYVCHWIAWQLGCFFDASMRFQEALPSRAKIGFRPIQSTLASEVAPLMYRNSQEWFVVRCRFCALDRGDAAKIWPHRIGQSGAWHVLARGRYAFAAGRHGGVLNKLSLVPRHGTSFPWSKTPTSTCAGNYPM